MIFRSTNYEKPIKNESKIHHKIKKSKTKIVRFVFFTTKKQKNRQKNTEQAKFATFCHFITKTPAPPHQMLLYAHRAKPQPSTRPSPSFTPTLPFSCPSSNAFHLAAGSFAFRTDVPAQAGYTLLSIRRHVITLSELLLTHTISPQNIVFSAKPTFLKKKTA